MAQFAIFSFQSSLGDAIVYCHILVYNHLKGGVFVDLPLSNNAIKVLKYIRRHSPVSKEKLFSRFNRVPDGGAIIVSLVDYYSHPIINFGGKEKPRFDYNVYIINLLGKAYLDDLRKDHRRFWIPVIISLVALGVAAFSLIKQYLPG